MTLSLALIGFVLVNFPLPDPYLRLLTAGIPFASAISAIRSKLNLRVVLTAIALIAAAFFIIFEFLRFAPIDPQLFKEGVNYALVGVMIYSAYKVFYKENEGRR